ncbi:ABC transporter permease [Paraburkholderia sp. B3]|uniref:ABC transporter permease n=1 Tax=Paraburkholderia sp. B3 TaxID=3134791 RepID=UPI003981CB22
MTTSNANTGAGSGRTAGATRAWAAPLGAHGATLRLACILAGVVLIGTLASGGILLRPSNLLDVVQQESILLVLVTAQFFVIATGGIDLSVGAVIALSSVVFVSALDAGPVFACFAALLSGCVFGLVNGLLVTFVRLPAFVVTLGTMQIGYSVAKLWSHGGTVDTSAGGRHIPHAMLDFYSEKLAGLPLAFWAALAVLGLGSLYLRTATGSFTFAIGGNRRAARLAGIPVEQVSLAAYATGSTIAAAAGLLFAMRVGYGDPHTGVWLPLDSIAAISVGGVSLTGGQGNLVAGFIGVLILALVDNTMNLVGISALVQPAVKGVILLLAVLAYSRKTT